MELKLIDVHKAQPALKKVMSADLPARTAFRLSRIAKVVGEIFDGIEEQRDKLVRKYGEASGEQITVLPENLPQYHQELNELLNETVKLDIEPIKFDLIENIQLTALDVLSLEPFIQE